MKIAQRHTLFSKHEEVHLSERGISRIRGQKTVQEVPYSDVKSIQLLCHGYSTAHEKVVYQCIVNSSGKSLKFSNALFNDPKTELDVQYRAAVKKLHDKVKSASNNTSFIQGSNFYYVMGWFILIFGSLALAMMATAVVWAVCSGENILPILRKSWVVAILPLGIIGVALPLVRRGRKSQYEPTSIPEDYLPVIQ